MTSPGCPKQPAATRSWAGKTAIDACLWLLANGVDPDRIRWIRPRDAWLLDRMAFQPLELVTNLIEGFSLATEASAVAESAEDLMARLEASGQFLRIDLTITPTMFRSASVSRSDLDALRTIENVVRLGHVAHIGPNAISLEGGEIPTDRGQVHVDCSAPGLRPQKGRPVFEGGRITLQPVRTVTPPFNAALAGYVEVSREDDREKRRLCPTNNYPNRAVDWIPNMRISLEVLSLWGADPDVAAWLERSRTNIARGMFDCADDPRMGAAITRLITYTEGAIENLVKLEADPDFATA